VFLLNQDAWLEDKEIIEKLVAISEKHPDFGIISPMHLSADKKKVNMGMGYNDRNCSKQMLSDLYCGSMKDIYETDYVNAAGWLLPRTTLSTMGGFDPLIFHYGEDDDYLNRARYHGLKIGICPGSYIIHDHNPGTETDWSRQLSRRSCLEDTEIFLDLNKSFNYHKLRFYYLRKYIKGSLFGDKSSSENALFKFKYIRRIRSSIERSRELNSKKQPNWIQ
jgi:GT2 family glycosyltransferase